VQIRSLTLCVIISAGLAKITYVSNEHIACVFYIYGSSLLVQNFQNIFNTHDIATHGARGGAVG
jgi:hypothetical protein